MLITDAAVQEAAASLLQSLGADWTFDPEAPADGAAHIIHSDGRGISFRPIFGGTTVQLWITGGTTEPNTADNQDADDTVPTVRLANGHRYNKAATLITEDDDVEPIDIIRQTLQNDLMPAFEFKPMYVGHRPWDELFNSALAAVAAGSDEPLAGADDSGPDQQAEGAPTKPDSVEETAPDQIEESMPEAVQLASAADDPAPDPAEERAPDLAHESEPDSATELEAVPVPKQNEEIEPEANAVEPVAAETATERAASSAKRRPRKRVTGRRSKPKTA
ncbi:hypothetical protein [Streptomyces sp. NPDC053367]|uniref:hypothetical protein n=1 Tax=Streptomyces sp. NPDC053367 TaxID=3365700 RepID=UPI0037D9225B